MGISEQQERKEAYLDALKKYPVERSILKRIHSVSDNVLDKWLYAQDRYPTFKACWELWMYQRKCQGMISRKLHILINRSMTRVTEVFQTTPQYKERLEKINYRDILEKNPVNVPNAPSIYVLNGENVTIGEAWKKLGYGAYNSLSVRIKKEGMMPGDDISHLTKKKRGRQRESN